MRQFSIVYLQLYNIILQNKVNLLKCTLQKSQFCKLNKVFSWCLCNVYMSLNVENSVTRYFIRHAIYSFQVNVYFVSNQNILFTPIVIIVLVCAWFRNKRIIMSDFLFSKKYYILLLLGKEHIQLQWDMNKNEWTSNIIAEVNSRCFTETENQN